MIVREVIGPTQGLFIQNQKHQYITFPSNNLENISINGFVRWEMENDFYPYQVQISKNLDFSDLVVDSIDILDKRLKYSLEPNSNYYCLIRTYHNHNKSQWSSIVKFKTEDITSYLDNNENNNLEIYPNPVNDILYVKPKYFSNSTDARIFDLIGNNVLSISLNGIDNIYKIDTSKLNNRIYIIKINNQRALLIK